jgi:enoyl-CoA hydratase/carnithine racemase
MFTELLQFWSQMQQDEETRVIAFLGEGPSFCAGLDLKGGTEMPRGLPNMYQFVKTGMDIAVKMRKCPQPIVCGIQGGAYGVGFAYALAADIRLLGESAKIQATFARIGLAATDTGTSYLLPRIVGFSNAADILLTARTLNAAEAFHMGLASSVVPDDQLVDAVLDKCRAILANGPFGIRLTKWTLNQSLDIPALEHVISLEIANQTLTMSGKDFMEGVSSLLEKRPANWKNK